MFLRERCDMLSRRITKDSDALRRLWGMESRLQAAGGDENTPTLKRINTLRVLDGPTG